MDQKKVWRGKSCQILFSFMILWCINPSLLQKYDLRDLRSHFKIPFYVYAIDLTSKLILQGLYQSLNFLNGMRLFLLRQITTFFIHWGKCVLWEWEVTVWRENDFFLLHNNQYALYLVALFLSLMFLTAASPESWGWILTDEECWLNRNMLLAWAKEELLLCNKSYLSHGIKVDTARTLLVG